MKLKMMIFGQMTDFDKLTLNVETDGSIEQRYSGIYAVELLCKCILNCSVEIEINEKFKR